MLCMIETIGRISGNTAPISLVNKTIELGQELLQKPIQLLEGVQHTLESLNGKYRLVVATKGDLLDQERKLKNSGLQDYFHHIEIMSDKQISDYTKLLKHLDCQPENFSDAGELHKIGYTTCIGFGWLCCIFHIILHGHMNSTIYSAAQKFHGIGKNRSGIGVSELKYIIWLFVFFYLLIK